IKVCLMTKNNELQSRRRYHCSAEEISQSSDTTVEDETNPFTWNKSKEDLPIMKSKVFIIFGLLFCAPLSALAQDGAYDGLTKRLRNTYRVSNAKTRSISPENFTGEKGKGGMATEGVASREARDLGQGWKVNPFVIIEPGKTFTLGEINGSGAIQHIWMTPTGNWRFSIIRMYW